jgi:uncharacterized membrane protein (DUF485 family)
MRNRDLPDSDRLTVRNNRLALGLAVLVMGLYLAFIVLHFR